MKGLTDISGIRVGHASDYEAITGCTAILCEAGAVAGCSIQGAAAGTEDFEVMNPLHVTDRVHGLLFAGGSAFGLEATSGVRYFLEQKGVGFRFGGARVPIVPGAILFDLGIGKATVRPTRAMGEAAAAAASDGPVKEGSVGAGTGATVGKALGMKNAMKGGIGSYTVPVGDGTVLVSSLIAVNAFGDVVDPKTSAIIAGARKTPESKEFINAADLVRTRPRPPATGANTTLGVVATNARLTKVQATRLAQLAHHGYVRSINPVHTSVDGDLIVVLSIGSEPADVNALGVAAAESVSASVLRAVRSAVTLGGVPGLKQ
jgi:L-aminopeptidase/D-esterase-like protein